jgi:hypothetical protein
LNISFLTPPLLVKIFKVDKCLGSKTSNPFQNSNSKSCPKQYVGQTSNTAAKRFNSNFYDVIHKLNKPVARHFNSRNHSASDMVLTPFEKLHVKDRTLLNVRERYWIMEKETATHGLIKYKCVIFNASYK